MAKEAGITIELERIIKDFNEEKTDFLYKCIGQAAKLGKREVVANSPENNGDYKKGWTVRTTRRKTSIESVIYNKDFPGMTHLLEESHIIRNQYGTPKRPGKYMRTDPAAGIGGKLHIGPAREAAEDYLLDLLKQGL